MSGIEAGSGFAALEKRVLAGQASDDEVRAYMTQRDLGGLPSERVYELESHFTREYLCERCGEGPIPCSIDCPQCGQQRPIGNHDEEQEGYTGAHRRKAGYRAP